MIKDCIKLLQMDDWNGTGSEYIEIAKGKYEIPSNIKIGKRKIKRIWQSKKA